MMSTLKQNFSLKMLEEKEYHFDEGVGVSLDAHVTDLKTRYPEARI